MSPEVIKLCSIVTEQAKTIERLESELNNVRAQLQARMVAPVPTLRRVPSTTSEIARASPVSSRGTSNRPRSRSRVYSFNIHTLY